MIIPELLHCKHLGYNKLNLRVLTQNRKTNGVTSWLTIVEVLLHDTVSEIVLRNCVHVIGSGANVEGVFDKDAAGPSFMSCRLVVCNTFLVSLLY